MPLSFLKKFTSKDTSASTTTYANGITRRPSKGFKRIEPRDELDLKAQLKDAGVNVNKYGVEDAKTLAFLFNEIQQGECYLEYADGFVYRIVEVVFTRVLFKDKFVLVETHDQLPDGRIRGRYQLPGRKKKTGEETYHTAMSCLMNDLDLNDNDVRIIPERTNYFRRRDACPHLSRYQIKVSYA
jgi:hypothetical protein